MCNFIMSQNSCVSNNYHLIILVNVVICICSGTRYEKPRSGLTQFPNDIPATTSILKLYENSITETVANNFFGLDLLEELSLGKNQLSTFPNLTYCAVNLKIVYFYDNFIKDIPQSLLDTLKVIEHFNIKGNQLSRFPNFTAICGTLKRLILYDNLIEFIPGELLNMLTKLEKLSLSANKLHHFPDVPGPGNTLQELWLSYNPLNKIPQLTQIGGMLQELYVNSIPTICDKYLAWILKITTLEGKCSAPSNLTGSALHTLTASDLGVQNEVIFQKVRQGLQKIPHAEIALNTTHIDVSENNISTISPEDLSQSLNLSNLRLSHNDLTEFPNLVYISSTLQNLDLSFNSMSYISISYLCLLTEIVSLNMKDNRLTYFSISDNCETKLEELNLSNNLFNTYPFLSTLGVNLKYLYLANNNISHIPPKYYNFGDRIELIDLSSNHLTSIPPITGPNIQNITIYLYNNPMVCDDKLSWLLVQYDTYVDGICMGPLENKMKNLLQMNYSDVIKPDKPQLERTMKASLLHTNTYSLLLPIEKHTTSTLRNCMYKCIAISGCTYINYKPTNTCSGGSDTKSNCHIGTAMSQGTWDAEKPDAGHGWRYYYIHM